MQTIWDVFTFLRQIANKPLGGYIDPDLASKALDAGQMAVFNRYWLAAYGSNQTGIEALNPFTQPPTVITPSAIGLVTIPSNLIHILSISRQSDGKIYRLVLRNELMDATTSALYPINSYPRYLEYATGIQLVPSSPNKVVLDWLKAPSSPVIAFTVDGDGNEVYDSINSVQLQFDRTYWNEIIIEACSYIGVSLSSPEILSLTNQQAKA